MLQRQIGTRFKTTLSAVLTLGILTSAFSFACVPASAEESSASAKQLAQETITGSAILHCFNWSYSEIEAALPDIAAAGYTAIQTSPIQKPKDYSASYTKMSDQWWKLYQPLNLSVADGETWLGTRSDFVSLCSEAENYNIKVVVDVVANHLANDGADLPKEQLGTYSHISSNIDEDLKSPDYFHGDNYYINDESRYTITQYHMGMPDLNTWNSYIQGKVSDFLVDCVNCGVDGFRFDAAKHIELPTDPYCSSDFWPTVTSAAKAAKSDIFMYGEILGGAGTDISNYTQYFAVTDNQTGNDARGNAVDRNAEGLAAYSYQKGTSPENCILWAESHDTYMDGSSSGVSNDNIVKTWAIVGSRADSTSLFLARPNAVMGSASTDTTWKSTAVAEVNKFKNFFDGTKEYLSSYENTAYVERGTSGVALSKLDGAGAISIPVYKMKTGTYKDQITGNTFTVANCTLTGTVGSTGVAVIYNENDIPEPESGTGYYLFGNINGADYACEDMSNYYGDYRFSNDGTLTATFTQDSYVAVKTDDNSNWYMTNGWLGKVSSATLYNTNVTGAFSNKLFVPGSTEVTFVLEEGENDTLTLTYYTDDNKPSLEGASVTVSDSLGINYYIDPGTVAPADLTIAVQWNDSSAEYAFAEVTSEQSSGDYIFTYSVPAKNMGDTIKVEIKKGSAVLDSRSYTVKEYLETLKTSGNDKTKNIAEKMLEYGANAQLLFGYNTNALVDDSVINYTDTMTDSELASLGSCDFANADLSARGLTIAYTSLLLEGQTSCKLYFTKTGTVSEFPAMTIDGSTLYNPEENGNYICYTIPGFTPDKLTESKTLYFVGYPNNTFTVTPGTYIKTAMESNDTSITNLDRLKYTLTSLYRLYQAAIAA